MHLEILKMMNQSLLVPALHDVHCAKLPKHNFLIHFSLNVRMPVCMNMHVGPVALDSMIIILFFQDLIM